MAIKNIKRIDAVIFDMDGVLIDTEILSMKRLNGFLRERGVNLQPEILNKNVGASGPLMWKNLCEYVDFIDNKEDFFAMYRRYSAGETINYRDYLNPNVRELLSTLSARNYRLAVASSTVLSRVIQILTECKIMEFFERILSGESFGESKPNPEIYIKTAEMLNLPVEKCVAVEDSVYGIAAAINAGMTVIAKHDDRIAIDQSSAHYEVRDIFEVASILEEINGT